MQLAVVLCVALLSLAASRLPRRLRWRAAAPWAFAVAGALAGPGAAGLLKAEDVEAAQPIVLFALGLAATRWGIAWVRSSPPVSIVNWIVSSALGAAVAVGLALIVSVVGLAHSPLEAIGAGLVAIAGILIEQGGHSSRARARLVVSLVAMALGAGLVLGLNRGVGLLCAAVLLGAALGALTAYWLGAGERRIERTSITLGGLALTSGAAAYLRLSVLVALILFGATSALLSRRARSRTLSPALAEVLLWVALFFIGARANPFDARGWLVAAAVLGLRWAAGVLERDGLLAKLALSPGVLPVMLVADVAAREKTPSLGAAYDGVLWGTLIAAAVASRWAGRSSSGAAR